MPSGRNHSETWAGSIHPFQALREYRQKMGRAAKLIVVGIAVSWWSAEYRVMDVHRYSGYTLLAIIVEQVANGVAVRMGLLYLMLGADTAEVSA